MEHVSVVGTGGGSRPSSPQTDVRDVVAGTKLSLVHPVRSKGRRGRWGKERDGSWDGKRESHRCRNPGRSLVGGGRNQTSSTFKREGVKDETTFEGTLFNSSRWTDRVKSK